MPSPDKTLAFCLKGTSTFFDRKMRSRRRPLLFCVLCARLLKGIKNITRRWRSKTYPLPQGGSPIAVPPQAGPTATLTRGHLSVSQSGAFSDCVTRFRGGALRHAKFPKTSYKVQLLDTRLHAACVSLNHRRRRDLISRSSLLLILFWTTKNTAQEQSCTAARLVCKPSSVLNGHLSRRAVTCAFKRFCRRAGRPTSDFSCIEWGLHGRLVAKPPVSSCLAVPPLHHRRRI